MIELRLHDLPIMLSTRSMHLIYFTTPCNSRHSTKFTDIGYPFGYAALGRNKFCFYTMIAIKSVFTLVDHLHT